MKRVILASAVVLLSSNSVGWCGQMEDQLGGTMRDNVGDFKGAKTAIGVGAAVRQLANDQYEDSKRVQMERRDQDRRIFEKIMSGQGDDPRCATGQCFRAAPGFEAPPTYTPPPLFPPDPDASSTPRPTSSPAPARANANDMVNDLTATVNSDKN